MEQERKALVAVESHIPSDPRVHRQIQWLLGDGWSVDTIGLGDSSAIGVDQHFELGNVAHWKLTKLGTALVYGLLGHRKKFEVLTLSRFAPEVRERLRVGTYDLILLNDRHFAPWVEFSDFTAGAKRAHVHLDLHEYFVPTLPRNSLWRLATAGYYEWCRAQFAHPLFTTRSTVNTGIARLYADELGIEPPAVIRNSPAYVDQEPTRVDPARIKLLHHGSARHDRGLRELIDALRIADERFTATFMLMGSQDIIDDLARYGADLGERLHFVPPSPMETLARDVNGYDLEVMFYRPRTRNLELALPNKLFEAVQGRLGLVTGESPMMTELIEQYGNGVIVTGWESRDLAETLNSLTAADISRFKAASNEAARSLSAETERAVFLAKVASTPGGEAA